MTTPLDTSKLPQDILRKAIKLRNCTRQIYLALYNLNAPSSCGQVAEAVGHSRPYVDMRLNQLVDMGYVQTVKSSGTNKKLFELI